MSTEHTLIQKAKQGDQEAFAQLMEQYQKPIYNLTLRMTGKPEDAEELAQTAFLNAWIGLARFQEESSFFTWLYRLATNACIDFIRHEKRRYAVLHTVSLDEEDNPAAQLPDSRYAPEAKALEGDLRETIAAALQSLSHEHREILVMRELDGLTYQEIAGIMELEMGTVKSRIARARLSLRNILIESGNYLSLTASNDTKAKGGGTP